MLDQEEYYAHPMFNPLELRIQTPAMAALEEHMLRCIWNGYTGAVIQGTSRCGKTTAVEAIAHNLRNRGKEQVPWHFFSVPKRDFATINSLYRSLCMSANLKITSNIKVESMLSNIIHFFLDEIAVNNSKRFILFVDEGQRLSIDQCNVFAELYDVMRSQFGILLTVFFIVNSDEAKDLLSLVQEKPYQHIYGRFFKEVSNFHGLRNEKEVEHCLAQYDTLKFPENTGPTYTEYFLSQAFNDGWRLATLSPIFWEVFQKYQKAYRLDSWGMQFFMNTVNTVLTDFLPVYGVEQDVNEMLHQSIQISGLVPSLVKQIK